MDIKSDVKVEKVFSERRKDLAGNLLKFHFSDGSGYTITMVDNEDPVEIARRLCVAASHILAKI